MVAAIPPSREQDMTPDSSSLDSPDAGRDADLLENLRPARLVGLLVGACLFLVIGIRLNELRPLFGGSGVGLIIVIASFAGSFIAGSSVLFRVLTVRRAARDPAHRTGHKVSLLLVVLGAVVALDLVGIIAAALS